VTDSMEGLDGSIDYRQAGGAVGVRPHLLMATKSGKVTASM
jgi:hypothetical protein